MQTANYIEQIELLYKEQDAIYHKASVSMGLSDSALCVLYILLFAKGDVTQQDVCRRSWFPKQTVNSTITKLKKDGFVELEPLPGSGLAKRILLTEAGKLLASRTARRLREAETEAYHQLTTEELETFVQLSGKLNAALRQSFTDLFQGANS